MSADKILDSFLEKVSIELSPLRVTERAQIILELRESVLQTFKDSSNESITTVIAPLGTPAQIARKYLLEKGLTPQNIKRFKKSQRPSPLKWLVIFLLSMTALLVISVSLAIWKFTPVFKINENSGRITILGGLIDFELEAGTFAFSQNMAHSFNGDIPTSTGQVQRLKIDFTNGKFILRGSQDDKLSWKCKIINKMENVDPQVDKIGNTIKIDFNQTKGTKCDLAIPKNIDIKIAGINGKMQVIEPLYNIDAKMSNGQIIMRPDIDARYNVQTMVTNGHSDSFKRISSSDPTAYKINFELANGKIIHQ